jgi:predicted NUDIX family NTP pyrophosphohydrolase
MATLSAGLVLYRITAQGELQVVLVHPGGPFWASKDEGAWSIPKGEYVDGDDPQVVARREFAEELGSVPPAGELLDLGEVRQAGGKRVRAFAIEGDLDVEVITSNTFEMEWPPRSGRRREFPEVDRASWFGLDMAHTKLLAGQRPLLDALVAVLGRR